MFVRCGHEQIQTLPNFCRISFLYDQTQKGTSFKRMPIDNSASIGMRRRVRFFCLLEHYCPFRVFLRLGRMTCSFFCKKSVAGFATKCPVKENVWARKSGFNREKTMGTSISYTSTAISASTCAETVGTACSATKNSSAATNKSWARSLDASPAETFSSKSADETETRQDKTRQDKTRQDKTRQDKTRQDKTRQDKTRQDKTRQDKTGQDKTRQGKTRQDKTRQDGYMLLTPMLLGPMLLRPMLLRPILLRPIVTEAKSFPKRKKPKHNISQISPQELQFVWPEATWAQFRLSPIFWANFWFGH